MLPAPGETSWLTAVVESERRVAGDVLERNGHMDLDWRKRASMVDRGVNCEEGCWHAQMCAIIMVKEETRTDAPETCVGLENRFHMSRFNAR
jgi:hypothetical protein